MKKSIFMLAMGLFATTSILTSCNSAADNVAKAEKNAIEANAELEVAKEAYKADMEKFRIETNEKIAAKNQTFADLMKNAAIEKKETKAEHEKKVASLMQRYADMKLRMDTYNADGKENWETFKAAYIRDMEQLNADYQKLTQAAKK